MHGSWAVIRCRERLTEWVGSMSSTPGGQDWTHVKLNEKRMECAIVAVASEREMLSVGRNYLLVASIR